LPGDDYDLLDSFRVEIADKPAREESVLAGDLEGYRDYMQRTRYRLIPGVW